MTPFTPPSLELLNQLIPAYHFVDFIAQGGMGAVYLAKQVSLDREVAVKILPMELTADPEFSASFKTEARAMARMNHPNLIAIYDFGEVKGMLFIAMEYVPGKSLYHSSWNKQIDPVEAGRIVMAICDGLSHAHDSGIIHRDIKPANILLTPKIVPKIGDFGLAQAMGAIHDGLAMGTPGYSAPEVIAHPENADRRSDLFAVGVILHELLTAQLPQPGLLASSLVNCSPEFDKIIQRATHPNPQMRYPDAQSMAKAIAEALKSPYAKPGAAAPPLNARRAPPPVRSVMPRPASPMMAKNAPAIGPPTGALASREPARVIDMQDPARTVGTPTSPVAAAKRSQQRNFFVLLALLILLFGAYQGLKIYAAKKAADPVKPNTPTTGEVKSTQGTAELAKPANATVTQQPPAEIPNNATGESAMASLARLRDDLKNGKRDELPLGSVRRGEMDFFHVSEPMTWSAAQNFAEDHGAHIAQPNGEVAIAYLVSMMLQNEIIWLGVGRGGRDQWVLLDGTPWSEVPSGIGSYATLSPLGTIRAAEGSKKNSFIMAWHRDGTAPFSLAAMLQRTRQSMESKSPVYPPGTRTQDQTHFLPIFRQMIRSEAENLAELSGARLATITSEVTHGWLQNLLADFDAPRGIWLGAEKSANTWQWNTKEPWVFTQWADGAPSAEKNASALVFIPKKGWQNVAKDAIADGVLLAWNVSAAPVSRPVTSVESTPSPEQTPTHTEEPAELQPLVDKVCGLLIAVVKERDDKIAANTRTFGWDLDVWLRGLKTLEKEKWQDVTEKIKDLTKNGRVPSAESIMEIMTDEGRENRRKPRLLEDGLFDQPRIVVRPVHEGIAKVQRFYFEKQKVIDADYLLRCGKVRDSFLAKIGEMVATAKKNSQDDVADALAEHQAEAQNLEDWVDSITKK